MNHNDALDAIRARLDIVEIIGAQVRLKKQGKRWVGCCPFHNEKTPSFSVSKDKGLFYCFGCHAGGDAFAFVMRHENVDFLEAARKLGEKVGVSLEPESKEKAAERRAQDELVRINLYAQAFFEHSLAQYSAAEARTYLHQRGVTNDMAHRWRLGFGGLSGELLAYLEHKKVAKELIQKAGLVSDDGARSLFDGRVIFPVFDPSGHLAGFGGRRLGEGDSPKYINTRESLLFAKRKLLFGWEHAEQTLRVSRRVILVEGYMDVLACHAVGLTESVAALGTAFAEDHARLLGRFAKEVVLLFDGDTAGRAATVKAAQKLLSEKVVTQVASLTDGRDPDSTVRELGADALRLAVKNARPALEYFIAEAFPERGPSQTVERKAEKARDLAPLLFALPQGLERELYTSRLAQVVGVSPEQLIKHLQGTRPSVRAAAPIVAPKAKTSSRELDIELGMIRDLLLYPELRPRLADLAEYALTEPIRAILTELAENQTSLKEALARHLGGDDRRTTRLLSIAPALGGENAEFRAQKTYDDVLALMKSRHVDAALDDVIRELASEEAAGGDVSDLVRRKQELHERRSQLLGVGHRRTRSRHRPLKNVVESL